MRVYLHYEGHSGLPHFTIGTDIDGASMTVDALAVWFASTYGKTKRTDLIVMNVDGQLLKPYATVSSVVADRDDVIFMDAVAEVAVVAAAATATATATTTPLAAPTTSPPPPSSSPSSSTAPVSTVALETYISQKNYRKARLMCEEAQRSGGTLHPHEVAWYQARVKLLSDAKQNHDAAERHASQALSLGKKMPSANLSRYSYTLAEAMFAAGDKYDEAEEVLTELLARLGPTQTELVLDARVLKAECLFELGKHENAAGLLNEHMHWQGAEDHVPTLLAYARFAMRYNKVEEPVRALLKAVVVDQKNKKCEAMLAELLSTDEGYAELCRQVPPSASSAAAYAFLATAVKNFSAVGACVRLLSDALRTEVAAHRTGPTRAASYALNLCHAHDVLHDYRSAFAVLENFCRMHPQMRVGQHGYTGAILLAALTVAGPADVTAPESVPEGDQEDYTDADLDFLAIGFVAVKIVYLQGRFALLPGLYAVIERTRMASRTPLHETSIRNETAYYQCAFQTLHCRKVTPDAFQAPAGQEVGAVPAKAVAPKVSSGVHCDPLWSLDAVTADSTGPDAPFEERTVNPGLLADAAGRPIYVCGDSHCMSPAWSVVYARAGSNTPGSRQEFLPRLLVPRLVTGVKQWHLRPDGTFYPKANFMHAVKSIPDGADVVFVVGEIDCREGLLVAVERDLYPTVTAGMDRVVDVFADVVKRLVRDRRFRVFIHPVVPVLDPTRLLVTEFNRRYRQRMEALGSGVAWLDMFDDLLVAPEGATATALLAARVVSPGPDAVPAPLKALRPGLDLDGAHLHPKYVALLEREFQRVM